MTTRAVGLVFAGACAVFATWVVCVPLTTIVLQGLGWR